MRNLINYAKIMVLHSVNWEHFSKAVFAAVLQLFC